MNRNAAAGIGMALGFGVIIGLLNRLTTRGNRAK